MINFDKYIIPAMESNAYALSSTQKNEVKSFINKASAKYFQSMKNNIDEEDRKYWVDDFLTENKSAPTVDSIDETSCDIPSIMLKYSKNTNHDHILFYEDCLLRYIKNDPKLSSEMKNKWYLYSEDYPGIFVELRTIQK